MKLLLPYKSLLKTCVFGCKKISIMALLISVAAIFGFLSSFCAIFSSTIEKSRNDVSGYLIKFNGINQQVIADCLKEFPKIISFGGSFDTNCYISYQIVGEDRFIADEFGYALFDKQLTELYPYMNADYTVTEGRDYTEEEITSCSDIVIVSKHTGFKLGDTIRLPGDKVSLTVIGIADKTVIPFSFFERYGNNSSRFTGSIIKFEKDLSDEQLQKLSEVAEISRIDPPPREMDSFKNGLITYGIIISYGVVLSVFAALQLYSLFLYISGTAEYNMCVMKITGCKSRTLLLILLLVTFTYIAVSLLLSFILFPLYSQLLVVTLRLLYIPKFTDFAVAFVIYSAIVLIAVLPGLKRITEKPLAQSIAQQ